MFQEAHILIIGAGAAGIAAACRLLEQGLRNITILEAEKRIGGRVHTVEFADNAIDLGAEYVHGERGNVSYELASPHGLLESSKVLTDTSKWIFADSKGKIIPREQSTQLLDIYYNILGRMGTELKGFQGTFAEYFTKEYYKALEKNPFTDPVSADQFLDWIQKYENIIECSDSWLDISGSGLAEYFICEGDPLLNWKGKGYKTLFDVLMQKFSSQKNALPVLEKVQFNKSVSSIDYRDTNKIVVKTTDKSEYVSDHVIFTPSLGVLKEKHDTLFTPLLPELKRRTIQGLSFGTVNKVFLEFPYQWWPKDAAGVNLIWSKKDREEFMLSVGNKNKWLGDIFHFSTVDHQPRLLSGWLTGPSARHIEGLEDSAVLLGFYNSLKKFYGETYDIPRPKNIIRSKWHQNESFRGSYSFRSIETERSNVWAKDLAEPVTDPSGKPVILFGGEATHDHFYSTVHGAVETGFREANRILEYYAKRKSNL